MICVVYFHLSSPSETKGIAAFSKEMTFAPTCFVWLRSKLPRDVVLIMLDHDSRNVPSDVNKFPGETCFICDQTKHVLL